MTQRRFVVLDRDGTINVERHYLSDPDQLELISGAGVGLRQLSDMGLGLVVVTNQSAVARGFFDRAQLDLIHNKLRALLKDEGVSLDGIYVCCHQPEDECQCRKPKTRLVELAAKDLDFDPHASFVIGDKPCDIELGQNVGGTTILVRTGYGAQAANQYISADHVVDDLSAAAQLIKNLMAQG